MPTDNVPITPGSGALVATREIAYSGQTAHAQVVGLATFGGPDDAKTGTDVSEQNPMPVAAYGELIEAVEAMRLAVQSLTRATGLMLPDTANRMRIVLEAISANLTLATVSTVSTVTAVTTLTNQTQIGGLSATEQIPSLMRLGADSTRRNISVT